MAKKKASKKTVDVGPEQPTKENIRFFMGELIRAGFVKKIPEEAVDQNAEAQKLRQFAERLSNQLRKFK
jgi:hypothetical protein